jgi:molybdopterin converting factor subunit 1
MRILFFAQVKDATGRPEIEWPDAGPLSTAQLWERLLREFPALARHRGFVRLARNGAYVADGEAFQPGDEVALIPPVSGG